MHSKLAMVAELLPNSFSETQAQRIPDLEGPNAAT